MWIKTGRAYRLALKKIAGEMGIYDYEMFCNRMRQEYGVKWQYSLRGYICSIAEEIKQENVNLE